MADGDALPRYQITTLAQLFGYSVSSFNAIAKSKYIIALADATDVSEDDVSIASVKSSDEAGDANMLYRDSIAAGDRRLEEQSGVLVTTHIFGTQAQLTANVVPLMQSSMFSNILGSGAISCLRLEHVCAYAVCDHRTTFART